MRDLTERQECPHFALSQCLGLCAPTHFHSRGAHQVDVIPQVNCDDLQSLVSNTAPIAHTTERNAYSRASGCEWWCGARRARSRALALVSAPVDEEYDGWEREPENRGEHGHEGDARGCV